MRNKIFKIVTTLDGMTVVFLHGLSLYYLFTGEIRMFLFAAIAAAVWSIDIRLSNSKYLKMDGENEQD